MGDNEITTIETTELATTDPGQIINFIGAAVEKLGGEGAEAVVAAIERLVDLQDRVDRRNAEKQFAEDLRLFQMECPKIRKNKSSKKATDSGGQFSYTFADLPEIEKTVGPLLRKHGFSYYWDGENYTDNDKDMLKVTFHLLHRNGHRTQSTLSGPASGNIGKMNDIQKVGTASTYLHRYTMISGLGLTTDDIDTDGADPTVISKEHATDLEAKIDELQGDKAGFLELMGAGSFDQIRQVDYKRALGIIKQKEKKLAGKDAI